MTITISRARLNTIVVAFIALAFGLFLAACGANPPTAAQQEAKDQSDISQQLIKNQPPPAHSRSQMRQNLIEIENAQADGVQTTSFFFNPNVQDPFLVCPSVGTPISAGASLTNPEQLAGQWIGQNSGSWQSGVIGQMDPNGVYTPQSSMGTYVLCIAANGQVVATYAEGPVHTEYAPARWDEATHKVVITGPPAGKFTKQ